MGNERAYEFLEAVGAEMQLDSMATALKKLPKNDSAEARLEIISQYHILIQDGRVGVQPPQIPDMALKLGTSYMGNRCYSMKVVGCREMENELDSQIKSLWDNKRVRIPDVRLKEAPIQKTKQVIPYHIDETQFSTVLQDLKQLDNDMGEAEAKQGIPVSRRIIVAKTSEITSFYVNTEGSESLLSYPVTNFGISLVHNDSQTNYARSIGFVEGMGVIGDILDKKLMFGPIHEILGLKDQPLGTAIVEDFFSHVKAKEKVSTGLKPVILSGAVAGTLVHEIWGHAFEADQNAPYVYDGGQRVDELTTEETFRSIEEVPGTFSLIDDPTFKIYGKWANGWTPTDAEGVVGKKITLIDKGKVNKFMHNRYTAALYNEELTGNARYLNSSVPIVRMRNTYMEPNPGGPSLNEMIDTADGALLLTSTSAGYTASGGHVNPQDAVMAVYGNNLYQVRKGELIPLKGSCSLTGGLLHVIGEIQAIGSENTFEYSSGICGKSGPDRKDEVHVSIGSPALFLGKAQINELVRKVNGKTV